MKGISEPFARNISHILINGEHMDNIEEKIKAIEEEISKTSYNKATSHHIGKLKAKISKLKEEQIKRSSGGSKGEGFLLIGY